MTVQTATQTFAASISHSFKGANKSVRDTALAGVASCAYAEGSSRAATIAQLKLALGKVPAPTIVKGATVWPATFAKDIEAARVEYLTGRVAQRITDFPKADMSVADRISFARLVVTGYAAPAKDGVKSKGLRKGQTGRRSIDQHKAVRAADEAWSQLKAEIGIGNAKPQDEKNKAKRKPRTPSSGITHSELVKGGEADKAHDVDSATAYITGMASTLLMFANKHAKVLPAGYGTAVNAFRNTILELDKARKG